MNPISDEPIFLVDGFLNQLRCRYCGGVERVTDGRCLSVDARRWLAEHEVGEATQRHIDCWKSKVSL